MKGKNAAIKYHLDLRRARYQEAEVTLQVQPHQEHRKLTFYLPTWSPGSYRIRDYSRHVFNVNASDSSGNPLKVIQKTKNRWEVIVPKKTEEVFFKYKFNGEELSPRTNYLDHAKAVLVGPATFMGIEGFENSPHLVTVSVPRGWNCQASLPKNKNAQGSRQLTTYMATHYDLLVDTPFVAGDKEHFSINSFTVLGIPHHLVFIGRRPRYLPVKKIITDLTKLVRETAAIFGGDLPYDQYYFHLMLRERDLRTGLEHMFCNLSMFYRYGFLNQKDYEDFLSLEAHEFFHVWNVKRIRASGLYQEHHQNSYHYDGEQYTSSLWLHEGFTSYYSWLILLRAGLITEKRFWEEMQKRLREYFIKPGRKRQSLEQSSWNTWINLYQPDRHHVNKLISYYRKGQLLGLFLDFYLRLQTRGEKSLDDVMRYLWKHHGQKSKPFPEQEIVEIINKATNVDVKEFYERYISGTDDLPLEILEDMGLEIKREYPKEEANPLPRTRKTDVHPILWLGFETKPSNNGVIVINVFEDGPASGKLLPEDHIIAVDRVRITKDNFKTILRDYGKKALPKTLTITYFRGDELMETKIRPMKPMKEFIIKRKTKLPKNREKMIKNWMNSKQQQKNK